MKTRNAKIIIFTRWDWTTQIVLNMSYYYYFYLIFWCSVQSKVKRIILIKCGLREVISNHPEVKLIWKLRLSQMIIHSLLFFHILVWYQKTDCNLLLMWFYRPQMKLRECNVFAGVCVCWQGVYLSTMQLAGIPPPLVGRPLSAGITPRPLQEAEPPS